MHLNWINQGLERMKEIDVLDSLKILACMKTILGSNGVKGGPRDGFIESSMISKCDFGLESLLTLVNK